MVEGPSSRQWCFGTRSEYRVPSDQSIHELTFTVQIIAIKLFSVSPSEMCDERTASKMSSFSTAKRNGLSGANIIHMTQLQQYWTTGIGGTTSKYKHTAHLTLLKPQNQPTTITLPAPTLQDLLNPESSDDDLADIDPYSAAFLEDGDSDDEFDTPVITRSGNIMHLEIDSIFNLAEPKLIARFDEPSPTLSALKAPAVRAPPKPLQKWSPASSDWATKDFDF